jgi:uncharacterized protein (DUF983 family)
LAHIHDTPSPLAASLGGRCPRCGRGRLFDGYLALRPSCEACGLDFSFADSADGPAFFVMSIVGILIVGVAMWVKFTYEPPIWLHMLLWLPLSIVLCLALVRPLKALMIALQFQQRAEQGRLKP